MRQRRDNLVYIFHRRIFERPGGIALGIADDGPAWRIWSFGAHARHAQRQGIGERHVAVVAVDEHRGIRRDRVDEFFRGKLSWIPFSFIPVTAQDPLAFRSILGTRSDTAGRSPPACRTW